MASPPLESALRYLEQGELIPEAVMEQGMRSVMSGQAPEEQVRRWLIELHRRGEDATELAAAARVLREFMTRVPIVGRPVMDTCGTGGTGARLFNISTASAIAAAACGVRIAKHGNRKVTSSTGSADVLAELGVAIDAPHTIVARCVDQVGIGFCFAPNAHPAVRNVSEVRRSIPHPTLFNWIGPLCNPAEAEQQVLGVGQRSLMGKFPEVLERLGVERFVVLHSEDGLCELSTAAPTQVIAKTSGGLQSLVWKPEDFGIQPREIAGAVVESPAQSAALIHEAFSGQAGVARDFVVLNAGAALWLSRGDLTLRQAAEQVQGAIDSGAALEKLNQLIRTSQES